MEQWSANTFQQEIPEIYQIELTNHCNLSCSHCVRQASDRQLGYLNLDLLHKMVSRGDFSGGYFVELQMYGESTLHPKIDEIVHYLKHYTNIKLGMSTNGVLIPEKIDTLSKLDYLTISIDSTDKEIYENLRGFSFDQLVSNISMMLNRTLRPIIDLQVINFFNDVDNLPGLIELAKQHKWTNYATLRSVYDCFALYYNRAHPNRLGELCLNPWLSVSIHWDGDVVPCCFSSGKEVVYGNLYNADLKTIWNESQQRRQLMYRQRHGQNLMPCSKCYMRSPVLFHMQMLMQNLRRGTKHGN